MCWNCIKNDSRWGGTWMMYSKTITVCVWQHHLGSWCAVNKAYHLSSQRIARKPWDKLTQYSFYKKRNNLMYFKSGQIIVIDCCCHCSKLQLVKIPIQLCRKQTRLVTTLLDWAVDLGKQLITVQTLQTFSFRLCTLLDHSIISQDIYESYCGYSESSVTPCFLVTSWPFQDKFAREFKYNFPILVIHRAWAPTSIKNIPCTLQPCTGYRWHLKSNPSPSNTAHVPLNKIQTVYCLGSTMWLTSEIRIAETIHILRLGLWTITRCDRIFLLTSDRYGCVGSSLLNWYKFAMNN